MYRTQLSLAAVLFLCVFWLSAAQADQGESARGQTPDKVLLDLQVLTDQGWSDQEGAADLMPVFEGAGDLAPLAPVTATASPNVTIAGVEAQILAQTNTLRRNNNRSPLVRDARLDNIARTYAIQIARDGRWGHWNIQARHNQARTQGFTGLLSENEGRGRGHRYTTNAAWAGLYVNMWWNSPGHRANMLNPNLNFVGIGFARHGDRTAAVQYFAQNRSSPSPAPQTRSVITIPQQGARMGTVNVNFHWTRVGNADYFLRIGSTPGGSQYFNRFMGKAVFVTAKNLPRDGRRFYVRLFTRHPGGQWQHNDYSYIARTGGAGCFVEYFRQHNRAWRQDSGSWAVHNQTWRTFGRPGVANVTTYNRNFRDFLFLASMKRDSSLNHSSHGLVFRASGAILADGRPSTGYFFGITRDGRYSVFKRINGRYFILRNWTASNAINRGSDWNSLRVVTYGPDGSRMSFRINNTDVFVTNDRSIRIGRIGFYVHRLPQSTGDAFAVNWVRLDTH